MLQTHHLIDKLLDGVVVTDVYGVQVDRVVDVDPHVVVSLHMVVKSLGSHDVMWCHVMSHDS